MSQKQITDGSHVYPLPTPFVFVILTTSEHVPLIQAATYGRLFYSLSIYGTAVPNVESSFIWRSPADFLPVSFAIVLIVIMIICHDIKRITAA